MKWVGFYSPSPFEILLHQCSRACVACAVSHGEILQAESLLNVISATFVPFLQGKLQVCQWVYLHLHLLNHWCKSQWIWPRKRGLDMAHISTVDLSPPGPNLPSPAWCRVYLLHHMWRTAPVPAGQHSLSTSSVNIWGCKCVIKHVATICTGGVMLYQCRGSIGFVPLDRYHSIDKYDLLFIMCDMWWKWFCCCVNIQCPKTVVLKPFVLGPTL